jgi:hypothetical protein
MAQLKDKAKGQAAKEAASKYDLPFAPSPLGMVGGLPDGLNPGAIRMLLKQMGIEVGEGTIPKAIGPTTKALQDVVERRGVNLGPPPGISDRRFGELLNLFGGRGPQVPK